MKKSKILVCAILLIALCAGVVAGTVSYMQYSTPEGQELVNTFIAAGGGNIIDDNVPSGELPDDATDDEKLAYNFNLRETEVRLNDEGTAYELVPSGNQVTEISYDSVVPGMEIAKDPKINVNISDNVSAYIFVEVLDATNNNFNYEIDTNYWTELSVTGKNNGKVYVYTDPTTSTNAILGRPTTEGWYELSAVNIIKDNLITANTSLSDTTSNLGTIKFYGYACQTVGFNNAEDAYVNAF